MTNQTPEQLAGQLDKLNASQRKALSKRFDALNLTYLEALTYKDQGFDKGDKVVSVVLRFTLSSGKVLQYAGALGARGDVSDVRPDNN